MKKTTLLSIIGCVFMLNMSLSLHAQTVVNTLADFRSVVQTSAQDIVLSPGNYNLEDLASGSRVITISGSYNTITLTGVHIEAPVGSIRESYIVVTGNNNTIIGGEIEDTYRNGLTEITDFVAYHQDSANLAYGLRGDAVMTVSGTDNTIDGIKLTVRGSHLYGYGSMYGINQYNTFGMNKRCGLLINGARNTLDNVELQMRAFGHGIYMQGDADETVIKNSLVEGRVRAYAELYDETDPNSFPYRSDYKLPGTSGTDFEMPFSSDVQPIPTDQVFSLSEDGIRAYNGTGSVTVENCTVKKMRGGIRLYLGGTSTVTNSTAIDCGSTNYNMSSGGTIINSSGNFAYAPLSDFRLSRNNMNIEWTIIPSPQATGPHNLIDILGNGHNIVLHRTPGPIDTTDRAIVVTGDNSTITNETEYDIVLESTTSGNIIINCGGGTVTDNGTNNTITEYASCEDICSNTLELMEAECFDAMSGIQIEDDSEGGSSIGFIKEGDYVMFRDINLTGVQSVNARTASRYDGGYIEVFAVNTSGNQLLTNIPIGNSGGWQNWETSSINLSDTVEGTYDVYFIFRGTRDGYLFNVNWFGFSSELLSIDSNMLVDSVSVYPNPTTKELTVLLGNTGFYSSDTNIGLYNLNGQKILAVHPKYNEKTTLDLSNIKSGLYFLRISNSDFSITKKVVKL